MMKIDVVVVLQPAKHYERYELVFENELSLAVAYALVLVPVLDIRFAVPAAIRTNLRVGGESEFPKFAFVARERATKK